MGRERAVDLVGGSGNGTPCRGPGGQPERITDPTRIGDRCRRSPYSIGPVDERTVVRRE